jgi:hypothetical protein
VHTDLLMSQIPLRRQRSECCVNSSDFLHGTWSCYTSDVWGSCTSRSAISTATQGKLQWCGSDCDHAWRGNFLDPATRPNSSQALMLTPTCQHVPKCFFSSRIYLIRFRLLYSSGELKTKPTLWQAAELATFKTADHPSSVTATSSLVILTYFPKILLDIIHIFTF